VHQDQFEKDIIHQLIQIIFTEINF